MEIHLFGHGKVMENHCWKRVVTLSTASFIKFQAASLYFVDAAYYYRQSGVVCRLVGVSVTIMSPAKMVEPTMMLFGLFTRVGSRNRVLDAVQIATVKGQFWGVKERPILKYRESAMSRAKTAEPVEVPCRLLTRLGPEEACIRLGSTLSPPGECDWNVHVRRCGIFVKLLWPRVKINLVRT